MLLTRALETAALLTLPLVALVAVIGVVVGLVQTIVQIQDQNVSFLPKLAAVVFIAAVAAGPALALLRNLFAAAAASLPRLAAH